MHLPCGFWRQSDGMIGMQYLVSSIGFTAANKPPDGSLKSTGNLRKQDGSASITYVGLVSDAADLVLDAFRFHLMIQCITVKAYEP